jgi:hypothetical protein
MSLVDQVRELIRATTGEFRKGPVVVQEENVTHIYGMPHRDRLDPNQCAAVDVHFLVVGVVRAAAEARRAELIELLAAYPWDGPYADGLPALAMGPSYLHLGGALEDQGHALRLMALGEVLGFWQVLTPERLGFGPEEAEAMAGRGMIMISGYDPEGRKKADE